EYLGIENLGFVFSGLASAEATLTNTEKELGVAVVDIGGGKIDFALYVEGALAYSSSIPIGARHITNDIAVGLRVSLESAEKIKIFLSQAFNQKNRKKTDQINLSQLNLVENLTDVSIKTLVDGIIKPRLEEIYKLIFEEIEKSGFGNNIPSGLVITGGGSLTVGILETGKRVVGLPIRLGLPTGVGGLIDEILEPQFATIVGLILYGEKNIIDEDFRNKNFNRIFKDFSFNEITTKLKNLLKQFIP
ncbi:MAG: cell division protein FtsA, partial [Microgenomates group bacterium]|nr:cell division protein FtsA [Microgenomates group bacterium]